MKEYYSEQAYDGDLETRSNEDTSKLEHITCHHLYGLKLLLDSEWLCNGLILKYILLLVANQELRKG